MAVALTKLPLDGTGTAVTNKVTKEPITIEPSDGFTYGTLKRGPFFGNDTFKMYAEDGSLLTLGKDYDFIFKFVDASFHFKKPIYGGLIYISTKAKGLLKHDYQALGDEFSFTDGAAVKGAITSIFELKRISFDSLINKPTLFPTIYHKHAAANDLKGTGELTAALLDMIESIKQDGNPTHRHDVDTIVGLTERLSSFISVGKFITHKQDQTNTFSNPNTGTVKVTLPKVLKSCYVVFPVDIVDDDKNIKVVVTGKLLTADQVGSKSTVDDAIVYISGNHDTTINATFTYNPDGSASVHIGSKDTQWNKPSVTVANHIHSVANALDDRVIDIIYGSDLPVYDGVTIHTASIEDLTELKNTLVTVIESEVNELTDAINKIKSEIGDGVGAKLDEVIASVTALSNSVSKNYVPKTGGAFERLAVNTSVTAKDVISTNYLGKLLKLGTTGAVSDFSQHIVHGSILMGLLNPEGTPSNGKPYLYRITSEGSVNTGIALRLACNKFGSAGKYELLSVVNGSINVTAPATFSEPVTMTNLTVDTLKVPSVESKNILLDHDDNSVDGGAKTYSTIRTGMKTVTKLATDDTVGAIDLTTKGSQTGVFLELIQTLKSKVKRTVLSVKGNVVTIYGKLENAGVFKSDDDNNLLISKGVWVGEWLMRKTGDVDMLLFEGKNSHTVAFDGEGVHVTPPNGKNVGLHLKSPDGKRHFSVEAKESVTEMYGPVAKYPEHSHNRHGSRIYAYLASTGTHYINGSLVVDTKHGSMTVVSNNTNALVMDTTLPKIAFTKPVALYNGIALDGGPCATLVTYNDKPVIERVGNGGNMVMSSYNGGLTLGAGGSIEAAVERWIASVNAPDSKQSGLKGKSDEELRIAFHSGRGISLYSDEAVYIDAEFVNMVDGSYNTYTFDGGDISINGKVVLKGRNTEHYGRNMLMNGRLRSYDVHASTLMPTAGQWVDGQSIHFNSRKRIGISAPWAVAESNYNGWSGFQKHDVDYFQDGTGVVKGGRTVGNDVYGDENFYVLMDGGANVPTHDDTPAHITQLMDDDLRSAIIHNLTKGVPDPYKVTYVIHAHKGTYKPALPKIKIMNLGISGNVVPSLFSVESLANEAHDVDGVVVWYNTIDLTGISLNNPIRFSVRLMDNNTKAICALGLYIGTKTTFIDECIDDVTYMFSDAAVDAQRVKDMCGGKKVSVEFTNNNGLDGSYFHAKLDHRDDGTLLDWISSVKGTHQCGRVIAALASESVGVMTKHPLYTGSGIQLNNMQISNLDDVERARMFKSSTGEWSGFYGPTVDTTFKSNVLYYDSPRRRLVLAGDSEGDLFFGETKCITLDLYLYKYNYYSKVI